MTFKYDVGDVVVFTVPEGYTDEGEVFQGCVVEIDGDDPEIPYLIEDNDQSSYWVGMNGVISALEEYDGPSLDDEDYDWEVEEVEMPTLREMLQQVRDDAEVEVLEAEESLARNRDLITDIDTALHSLQG